MDQTSTGQGPKAASSEPTQEASKLEKDLREELNKLGASFLEVVKVAWQSDQRKQLEIDLKGGLNSVADNLEDGFKKVSESPQTKEFLERAEDVAENVAEKVRQSEVAQELGQGLLRGLRSLSDQIDKLSADLQAKRAAEEATTQAAQDIPVKKADAPSTDPSI